MRPDLVIFDCDGVLVDREPVSLEMIVADLRARGLDLSLNEADALFTGATMRFAGEAARAALGAEPVESMDEVAAAPGL